MQPRDPFVCAHPGFARAVARQGLRTGPVSSSCQVTRWIDPVDMTVEQASAFFPHLLPPDLYPTIQEQASSIDRPLLGCVFHHDQGTRQVHGAFLTDHGGRIHWAMPLRPDPASHDALAAAIAWLGFTPASAHVALRLARLHTQPEFR